MLALPSRLTRTTKTLLCSHFFSKIPKMDLSGSHAQALRNHSSRGTRLSSRRAVSVPSLSTACLSRRSFAASRPPSRSSPRKKRKSLQAQDPEDGNWGFNIAELEAMFPEGMVERVDIYKELPQWGESVMDARGRYAKVVQALADKRPMDNLLLVTHGEGVGSSISYFLEGATVYKAEYCAYSELRRPIFCNDQSPTAGKFEVITNLGQTGISYSLAM